MHLPMVRSLILQRAPSHERDLQNYPWNKVVLITSRHSNGMLDPLPPQRNPHDSTTRRRLGEMVRHDARPPTNNEAAVMRPKDPRGGKLPGVVEIGMHADDECEENDTPAQIAHIILDLDPGSTTTQCKRTAIALHFSLHTISTRRDQGRSLNGLPRVFPSEPIQPRGPGGGGNSRARVTGGLRIHELPNPRPKPTRGYRIADLAKPPSGLLLELMLLCQEAEANEPAARFRRYVIHKHVRVSVSERRTFDRRTLIYRPVRWWEK